MLKNRKFQLILGVILLLIAFSIDVHAAKASVSFSYTLNSVKELEFNKFEVNLTSSNGLTGQQINDEINISGEKSSNIIITSIIRNGNNYLIYGSLKNYKIPKNKLFNPWFNTSFERIQVYNISGAVKGYQINISTEYNNSDRWYNVSDNSLLPYWNETGSNKIWVKLPENGTYQIGKAVNNSNFYPKISYGWGVFNASEGNYFDDFDGSPTNSSFLNPQWTLNSMTVNVTAGYVKLNKTSAPTVGSSLVSNKTFNSGKIFEARLRINNYQTYGIWGLDDGNLDQNVATDLSWLDSDTPSDVAFYDTALANHDYGYLGTGWINYKILWNTSAVTSMYNDANAFDYTNMPNPNRVIHFYQSKSGAKLAYDYDVDWVFIRNLTAIEPTISLYQNQTLINITSWSNTATNNQSLLPTASGNNLSVSFNVTVDGNPFNYSWTINGTNQNNNNSMLTHIFKVTSFYYVNLTVNDTLGNYAHKNWTLDYTQVNISGQITRTPIPNCGLNIIHNNTNLAPTIEPSISGTGERVNATTYYANESSTELLVFAHAMNVGETAGVFVYFNNTLVMPQSGRPLGGAETAYRGVPIIVPRYTFYRVEFFNFHHYEWRESKIDLDISGCNYPSNNDSLNNVISGIASGLALLFAIIALAICLKKKRG